MPPSRVPCTLRPATLTDIPPILSLHLTSFRTFPLFTHLYSPLRQDISFAKDTVFFWRRRVRAAILDPQSSVVVAVAEGDVEILDREEWGGDDLSERFLEWGREVGGLTQEGQEGKTVLGFAIWRWKGMDGEDMGEGKGNGWMESVIDYYHAAELWIYSKTYTRKDLNVEDYAAYSKSEDVYQEKHYKDGFRCLNLDNLCVDFRYQYRGVGRALIEWGVKNARERDIPIKTEASEEGAAFYKRVGFKHLDDWIIPTSGGANQVKLAVLQMDPPGS